MLPSAMTPAFYVYDEFVWSVASRTVLHENVLKEVPMMKNFPQCGQIFYRVKNKEHNTGWKRTIPGNHLSTKQQNKNFRMRNFTYLG